MGPDAKEVVGKLVRFMNAEKEKKRMTGWGGAYAELEGIRNKFTEIFEGMLEAGYKLEGKLEEDLREYLQVNWEDGTKSLRV